jgi:hypothetical protein
MAAIRLKRAVVEMSKMAIESRTAIGDEQSMGIRRQHQILIEVERPKMRRTCLVVYPVPLVLNGEPGNGDRFAAPSFR